jgi:hypothetical protein
MGRPVTPEGGVLSKTKIDMSHQEMTRLLDKIEDLWEGCECGRCGVTAAAAVACCRGWCVLGVCSASSLGSRRAHLVVLACEAAAAAGASSTITTQAAAAARMSMRGVCRQPSPTPWLRVHVPRGTASSTGASLCAAPPHTATSLPLPHTPRNNRHDRHGWAQRLRVAAGGPD